MKILLTIPMFLMVTAMSSPAISQALKTSKTTDKQKCNADETRLLSSITNKVLLDANANFQGPPKYGSGSWGETWSFVDMCLVGRVMEKLADVTRICDAAKSANYAEFAKGAEKMQADNFNVGESERNCNAVIERAVVSHGLYGGDTRYSVVSEDTVRIEKAAAKGRRLAEEAKNKK